MTKDRIPPPERSPTSYDNGPPAGAPLAGPTEHREVAVSGEEDVFLDVPRLSVDKINLRVANLRARVSLSAGVLSLLRLNVGADVDIDQVELDIEGVEAQALLKVRLDNVAHILDRVLNTIDAHPEIVESVVENAGEAIGRSIRDLAPAVTDTVRGVETAVPHIGRVADEAAYQLSGATDEIRDIGRAGGQATRQMGGDVDATTQDAGAAAGQAARDVGPTPGDPARVSPAPGEAAPDVAGTGFASNAVNAAARLASDTVGTAVGVARRLVRTAAGLAGSATSIAGRPTRPDPRRRTALSRSDGDDHSLGPQTRRQVDDAVQQTGRETRVTRRPTGDVNGAGWSGQRVTRRTTETHLGPGADPDISAASTVAVERERDLTEPLSDEQTGAERARDEQASVPPEE
jgi:hypothetical protein